MRQRYAGRKDVLDTHEAAEEYWFDKSIKKNSSDLVQDVKESCRHEGCCFVDGAVQFLQLQNKDVSCKRHQC